MEDIDGVPIYGGLVHGDPDDPDFENEVRAANPHAEISISEVDIDISDPKPEAKTPEEAAQAFDEALLAIANDPEFIDPDDDRYVRFRVGQFHELFRFRARSWFSTRLHQTATGMLECPPGHRLEKYDDPHGEGWYRMTRRPGPLT
jgi:hypothetical protein